MTGWKICFRLTYLPVFVALNWLDVLVLFSLLDKNNTPLLSVFLLMLLKKGEQLSMSWMKKLWAACLPESEPLLLFTGCVLCPFSLLLFASCRNFSDFSLRQRSSHQWFLLFGVNIPNVSLFIYCISAVTERLCEACNNGEFTIQITQRTARKRDVKPNNFIPLCLSRSFPSRVFVSKCIMLKK